MPQQPGMLGVNYYACVDALSREVFLFTRFFLCPSPEGVTVVPLLGLTSWGGKCVE